MKFAVAVILSAILALTLAKPAPGGEPVHFAELLDFDNMFKFLDTPEEPMPTADNVAASVNSIVNALDSLGAGGATGSGQTVQAILDFVQSFGRGAQSGGAQAALDSILNFVDTLWDKR